MNTSSPVQGRLSVIITGVDISLGLDQLLHHSLDSKPSSKDERSGAVICLGLQVGGSVPQQDLEDSLSICSHGGVKRSPSCVVRGVGISLGIQQLLGSISSGIPGSQVQGCLACLVHLSVDISSLGYQVLDHSIARILFIFIEISLVKSSSSEGSHHERREPTGTPGIHLSSHPLIHHHLCLRRCESTKYVSILNISSTKMLSSPSSLIRIIIVSEDGLA